MTTCPEDCNSHQAMTQTHLDFDRRLTKLETVWDYLERFHSKLFWIMLLIAINCILTGVDATVRIVQLLKLVH